MGRLGLPSLLKPTEGHPLMNHRIETCLLLSLCLVGFPPWSSGQAQEAAEQQPVLTLDDAVRFAQENNRTIKNAVLAASIAADRTAEARTYRYPSLNIYALGSQLLTPVDFKFDAGTFGTYPGIGPIPATQTSIHTPLRPTFFGVTQLTQPLSQQHKIGLNIRLAKLNEQVNNEKLRAQKQAVANQVKQAYYSLARTQSAIEVSQKNLELDRALQQLVQHNVEQKTALKSDEMDISAKLAQEEYNQLMLGNTLATQKEQLNELMGRDVRTAFSLGTMPEATVVELDSELARTKALAARPELKQARLSVEQAELNRRVTKSDYIPDISLAVSDLSLANTSSFLPSNVASAGVLLSWNPLDWGRRKHELAEATKTIEQSKNSVKELEDQILVEVGDKFRKLQQTRALLHATDLGLASAQEKLRVTMNQYEQKTALTQDVLQQKAALQNATDQHQQALVVFWTAKSDFEKSLGED
jgi:outer membrane protein